MSKFTSFNKHFFTLIALMALSTNTFAQLPYNTNLTQSHYNDSKTVIKKEGSISWENGVKLGKYAPFNWDDKYIVIALNQSSIPYQLSFKYKCNSTIATTPDWYVEESSDNSNWSRIWSTVTPTSSSVSVSDDVYTATPIDLSKSTKYIKLCYSGNYSGTISDIKVTDQAYVNDPVVDDEIITSLDFGTATISSGKAVKSFDIERCNINELSVTCDNTGFFAVTPASFGAKAKYGSQTVTVTYDRDKEVGDHSATITISNGSNTKTISVSGTTTKRSQAIHWNAALTATNFTLNAGENLTGDAIATADNEEAEIAYESSDANVIAVSPDGKTLYAIDNGTAIVTITASGNDIYDAVVDSKEFIVTAKKKQTINWEQNLLGLKTTQAHSTITLDATATSGGVITYAIEGGSAECITLGGENNATLTVTGAVGEAYIIATQEGGLIGEEEWISATYRKHVKVRDPNAACDEYALADKSFTFGQGHKSPFAVQEYKLEGKPTTLTFSAKAGGKQYIWSEREPIYIDQYANFGSGLEWKQITALTLDENNKGYGPYNLEESATKIRFRTGDYSKQEVSNISVPRKKEFIVSETAIDEEAERNVRWSKTISVSRSNMDVVDILVESDNAENPFEVSKTSIGTDCDDRATESFEVSVTPREKGVTYTGRITLTDGKANPNTHVIELSVKTIAFNQSINDFDLPETAMTTDQITLSATATSGLEVMYLSSDSTIAYVDSCRLVILNAGTVSITALQPGDDRYNATELTKTIVISQVPSIIFDLPTASELKIGQTLAESQLTGGSASVEGSFAWASPETEPEEGTHAYDVIFTPADAVTYAPATTSVEVTVSKYTQEIEWTQSIHPMGIDDILVLDAQATSGLAVTFTTSDSTVAYVDGNELHAVSVGTVTITATQEGNDQYEAAQPVAREITVQEIVAVEPQLIQAPEATSILYGQPLAASQLLNGATETEGTFQWADSTLILAVGTHAAGVVFLPADTFLYLPLHLEVNVTVLPLSQTITWEDSIPQLYIGKTFALTATASSDLPVLYTSSDSTIAYVDSANQIIALAAGEVTLTAYQEGNEIYTPAEPVEKNLTVLPLPTLYSEYETAICQGDSVEFAGVWYNDSVATEVLLEEKNFLGGDSVVRLTVNVNPTFLFEDSLEIHAGMADTWQEIAVGELPEGDTTLIVRYASLSGCDSVYTLRLTVLPMITTYGNDTVTLCAGERFTYEGKTYRRSTVDSVLVSERNQFGGDSIVELVVRVLPIMRMTNYLTISEGDSVIWQDIDLSLLPACDTTLTVTYSSVNGCDSIFILNLKIEDVNKTGVDNIDSHDLQPAQKFFRNGQMYIRKNGRIYNLQGIKVKEEEN